MLGKYCENENFTTCIAPHGITIEMCSGCLTKICNLGPVIITMPSLFQLCSILSPDLHILPRALSDLKPDELAFDRRRNEM